MFPDTNLPDSGSFCQSPLGTSGRCVPYQECRFLFNDEFLARRSLCGFNGRVSLVCCPQQGQGFGNGFGGGLGGGGGGGGIVFPEVSPTELGWLVHAAPEGLEKSFGPSFSTF